MGQYCFARTTTRRKWSQRRPRPESGRLLGGEFQIGKDLIRRSLWKKQTSGKISETRNAGVLWDSCGL